MGQDGSKCLNVLPFRFVSPQSNPPAEELVPVLRSNGGMKGGRGLEKSPNCLPPRNYSLALPSIGGKRERASKKHPTPTASPQSYSRTIRPQARVLWNPWSFGPRVGRARFVLLGVFVRVVLDEVLGLLHRDGVHVADLVSELHTVKFVRVVQQLGTERGGDELGSFR